MKPLPLSIPQALSAAIAALDDVVGPVLRFEAEISDIVDDIKVAREALERAMEKYSGMRIDYANTPGMDR